MKKEKFDFREVSKIAKRKIETEHPGLKKSSPIKFIDLWKNECAKMCRGKRNYLPAHPKTLKYPVPVIIHLLQSLEWNNKKLDLHGCIEPSMMSGYIFRGKDCNGETVIRSFPVSFLRNVQICEFLAEAKTKNEK